jgi:hypothetical protein
MKSIDFKNALQNMCEIFINNKNEMLIEDAGIMVLSLKTITPIEKNFFEMSEFNINFIQLQDKSFRIEDANITTKQIHENGQVINSEFQEVLF